MLWEWIKCCTKDMMTLWVTNLQACTHLQHVAYMWEMQVTHKNDNELLYYGESIQKYFRLTQTKIHYPPAMSPHKEPCIQVNPLDIENKSVKEHVQLALAAIACNGFHPNGQPWLPLWEAAKEYRITKGWLTNHFNNKQTKCKAHQHEQVLDYAAESVLIDWIKEMGHHGVPLHPSTVALHALAILGKTISKHWVSRFHACHPELKARWTSGLKKCHAGALLLEQIFMRCWVMLWRNTIYHRRTYIIWMRRECNFELVEEFLH